jgi:hypothetical protein
MLGIFAPLLTDEDGFWRRFSASVPLAVLFRILFWGYFANASGFFFSFCDYYSIPRSTTFIII